jgi:hypothetical protein
MFLGPGQDEVAKNFVTLGIGIRNVKFGTERLNIGPKHRPSIT